MHFVHSIELGDINMKGFLFFFSELFFGILTGRTVGTRGGKNDGITDQGGLVLQLKVRGESNGTNSLQMPLLICIFLKS